ncbi:MAG: HEAT repeat domain-containing protein [Planctomycetota bacterium]|nr:HEAT repeat domain-containing protein [Planctomycetota bacterium]
MGKRVYHCRVLVSVALLLALGVPGLRVLRAGEVLDNAKILKMAKDGVAIEVILKLMEPGPNPAERAQASNCRFDSSSEAMSEVQKACKDGGWKPEDVTKLQTKIIELANKDQKYLKELVDRALNVFRNADDLEYSLIMRQLVREGKRVVPYLQNKLDVEDERERGGVVDAFGRIGDKSEAVVRNVALMLTDRSKPVRERAAKAVVALSGQTTAEELIAKLNSRNEKLDGVAMALGYLGDQRAIEALAKLLKTSDDGDARLCAAFSLGELRAKTPAAAEALLEAVLDERDEKLRESAARALGRIGDKRAPAYIMKAFHRFRPGRDELIRDLSYFKDIAALEFLVGQVENDDPKVKRATIETLRIMTQENETDAEGWRAILEVLRTRPDWIRADSAQPRIPDAGANRDAAPPRGESGDKSIPTSTR